MKFLFGIFLLAFCFTANFSQTTDFEANFEKNKTRYKLDIYGEGEDATSGYDYLVYKKGESIEKVRVVWSSLSYTTYRIEDYYFKNGKLVALLKYSFAKKYYNAAKKGTKVPMKPTEKLYLTDSKLTSWTENGEAVAPTDQRWAETERQIIESANYIIEGYQRYKEESN